MNNSKNMQFAFFNFKKGPLKFNFVAKWLRYGNLVYPPYYDTFKLKLHVNLSLPPILEHFEQKQRVMVWGKIVGQREEYTSVTMHYLLCICMFMRYNVYELRCVICVVFSFKLTPTKNYKQFH